MIADTAGGSVARGILLVAHGTIERLEDIPEFLAKIRRGRPAPPELVEELRHRYEAIGGSPLLEITRQQAQALEALAGLPVFVGMRLWRPSIEDALRAASTRGIYELAVIPLAPFSVRIYHDAALGALARVERELAGPLALRAVRPWGSHPLFVEAYAERIRSALAARPGASLVLTAHSLPRRLIAEGDRYASEVEESAAAIGARLNSPYTLAYQSPGASDDEWLGPDLRGVLAALSTGGQRRVVVAPFGFLADHVETLYDLDVEAMDWSRTLGLELTRVPALNVDFRLIGALRELAFQSLNSAA